MTWILAAIGVALVIGAICTGAESLREERRRRRALFRLAERLDMRYEHSEIHPPPLRDRLEFFRAGREGKILNTLSKRIELNGRTFRLAAGDYRYELSSGSDTIYCACSYVYAQRDGWSVPATRLYRRVIDDSFALQTGMHDVQIESAEFNKDFAVRSFDRRFAYDLVHPRTAGWLQRWFDPDPLIDIDHDTILLAAFRPEHIRRLPSEGRSPFPKHDRRWDAAQFERHIEMLIEFLDLFPEHLARDLDTQTPA